jgi:hypothetical protein
MKAVEIEFKANPAKRLWLPAKNFSVLSGESTVLESSGRVGEAPAPGQLPSGPPGEQNRAEEKPEAPAAA